MPTRSPRLQPFDAGPDRIDPADDLMARDDRHLRVGQLAIDDMQIRAADAAGGHLHANLARPGLPIGEFGPFKSGPKLLQHHRLHGVLQFCGKPRVNVTRAITVCSRYLILSHIGVESGAAADAADPYEARPELGRRGAPAPAKLAQSFPGR